MAKKKVTSKNTSKYQDTIDMIEKKYGKGTIQIGGGTFLNVRTFSSGIYTLDWALGCGGIPRGRTIEVFGNESSGKTTIALKMIASCQRTIFDGIRGAAAFIDAEHALDPEWAEKNGVAMDELMISQPSHGEEALDTVEMLAKAGVPLVVVDSVAALVPKKELDGDISDANVGMQARLISKAMRKLTGACSKSLTTIVFINQIREKVGVMFGSPEVTPGGRALKFYSSVRIDMRNSSLLKGESDVVIGRLTKAKIIKNKVAPPWKTAEIEIFFGSEAQKPVSLCGADGGYSLYKAGMLTKVLKKNGNFTKYGKVSLGNGIGQAVKSLNGDEDLFMKVREEVLTAIRPKETVEAKDIDEDDDVNIDEDE